MKAPQMCLRAITNSVPAGINGSSDVGPGFGRTAIPACACRRMNSEDSSKVDGRMRARRPFRADRKSTRLNSSHLVISYAVFCLKKKNKTPGLPATAEHWCRYETREGH